MIASNNDGVWNEQGATLAFSLAAAWYQTWWFRGVSLAVFLALLWCIYRLHVRSIHQRSQQLALINANFYSISVRTELAEDLPQVMGDRMQLKQVLMNLMMNSIDAMKEVDGTRELTINSQRGEKEQLVVSVSDTGVGLPPEQADQIFNAFFTTKPNGTGMGLRISRSIVESHAVACGLAQTLTEELRSISL